MVNHVVRRARSLIGCPFRPQGRDPSSGLDCVGLVCAVFGIPSEAVPRDYRMRGGGFERLTSEVARFFHSVRVPTAGDIVIFQVAADQPHLGILTKRGIIHADAKLRRVVETPGAASWPMLSAHRRKIDG
jgi:cell wall-associated NlpC family hydrolase